jgi:hypothetical protein
MNKEQEELLDEVYLVYADSHWTSPSNPNGKLLSEQLFGVIPMEHSKESFINEIKTNSKFSKKWGLKIEERDLSYSERERLFNQNRIVILTKGEKIDEQDFDNIEVPTKLITIIYNDKTLESYE